MSNDLAISNAPTIAFPLQVGTAKKPQSFVADAHGVALTTGKHGREARTMITKSMPEQAVSGAFVVFGSYLAATFPKLVAHYSAKVETHVDYLKSRIASGLGDETDAKILGQLENNPIRSRVGFDLWVQLILKHADNTEAKKTKAQEAAIILVREYVALRAKPAPAPAAPAAE